MSDKTTIPERVYRGSPKHKNRPASGPKGTLCPEWTHASGNRGYSGQPDRWPWPGTPAHALFEASKPCPEGSGKRYATSHGIAFAAQQTNDGTWHGYPVPWNEVPSTLKDRWTDEELVTAREKKRYRSFPKDDIRWALESDGD